MTTPDNSSNRLITLAIHTYEKATILKSILETEGIEVALQNVNLVQPVVSSGVRVRIHERDLAKALRIIESSDLDPSRDGAPSRATAKVMVPVDFSEHSDKACEVAFQYAASTAAEVLVLHSFITPTISLSFQVSFEDLSEEEAGMDIEEAANRQLARYADGLRSRISDGQLPPVKFSTTLVDDVPEDAINSTARTENPTLIVMGTRGGGNRDREIMGSVTGEVLDSCRYPVLTVPANFPLDFVKNRSGHLLFFCNCGQSDLLALDLLYSLFPHAAFDVTLVNIPSKKQSLPPDIVGRGLIDYCRQHMSRFNFTLRNLNINDIEVEFQAIEREKHIDLVAIPNKKRNIFSRLFNPGLAHRMLFHADLPLLMLPV